MRLALCCLFVLCGVPAHAAPPTTLTGRVIGVTDGDTLTLLDARRVSHKIRLAGIDAPEKAMPFGTRAKQALSTLAYRQEATASCRSTDRYGRLICAVRVDDRDAGRTMIDAGLAWHYARYARTQPAQEAATYAQAQHRAATARIGLWRDAAPIAPWTWRANKRGSTRHAH